MGLTYVTGTVAGPTGTTDDVEFLIDSGAQYTLLPETLWQRLEITPKRVQAFRLADGTAVERRVGECHLSVPQGSGHTSVILGEPGDDQALLGVVTLEELGLMLNPFNRELQPMRMIL